MSDKRIDFVQALSISQDFVTDALMTKELTDGPAWDLAAKRISVILWVVDNGHECPQVVETDRWRDIVRQINNMLGEA